MLSFFLQNTLLTCGARPYLFEHIGKKQCNAAETWSAKLTHESAKLIHESTKLIQESAMLTHESAMLMHQSAKLIVYERAKLRMFSVECRFEVWSSKRPKIS